MQQLLYIGKSPKGKIPHTWHFWNIKIRKPPYVSSLKIIGLLHFLNFWVHQKKITIYSLFGSPCSKYKSSMPPRQVPDRCQVHRSQRGEQPPHCERMSHQFQVSIFDQKSCHLTLPTAKTFQNLYSYTCRVGLAMPKYSPLKPKADQVLGSATSWKNSWIRNKTKDIEKLQQNLKFWRKAVWLSPVWWTCGWRRWGI